MRQDKPIAIIENVRNGNIEVSLYEDGTKTISFDGQPKPEYPTHMDVCITKYCDMGCPFCHEMATTEGTHGDLKRLTSVIEGMPMGTELAIGGGNPMAHPDMEEYLKIWKGMGFVCNMTMNQGHLERYREELGDLMARKLIYGLGISVDNDRLEELQPLKYNLNVVLHLIAGIHDISSVEKLTERGFNKFLVLGYKDFGRGMGYHRLNSDSVDECIKGWLTGIRGIMGDGKRTISFDNLAIEQIKPQRFFSKDYWDEHFFGEDFVFSMYLDAVNERYGRTSREGYGRRVGFSEKTLREFFGDK